MEGVIVFMQYHFLILDRDVEHVYVTSLDNK